MLLFRFILVLFPSLLVGAPFDHTYSSWNRLLNESVSEGLVDYKGFQKQEKDFNAFLSSLTQVSLAEYSSFKNAEKLAFLINSYNAFTIRLILDHYPIKSITEIGGPFAKINLARGAPWKKEFFELLGQKRHLDWIEHEKLRKDFKEPRMHFAIVCASIGCPELANEAYRPDKLEEQLKAAKTKFLKVSSKNRYDSKANVLYLSPIFDWFKADFIKDSTLIEFVQDTFPEKIKPDALIEYTDYSWKLNEWKKPHSESK